LKLLVQIYFELFGRKDIRLFFLWNNILCLIAMIIFVWMGSMIGYSKIIETIQQFRVWKAQVDAGADLVDATKDLIDKTQNQE
jgi:cytosine/uracil/thiamine/allantoin permease